MTLSIDVVTVLEIVFIVLTLKMILVRWHPPVQESLQALICVTFGLLVGGFLNPTKEGVVIGIITGSITFYGGEILNAFTDLRSDLQKSNIDLQDITNINDKRK